MHMTKRYAQLTENGWMNIFRQSVFDAGGLADRKAYAFISTDEDYAGGGCRYYAGLDTPEESIGIIDEYEFDLDDGAQAIWPLDLALFAASQAALYRDEIEDEDEDEDVPVTVTRALLKMAPADRTE